MENLADFSAGDFEISGTEADVTAPVVDVSSLKVSQKTAVSGDTVKVSIKVTDETEVQSVWAYYKKPQTGNTELLWLNYNSLTGYYEGEIEVQEKSESGTWKIDHIYACDVYSNSKLIYNENVSSWMENLADFSAGDFSVNIDERLENIQKLSNVTVYTKNMTITDQTIDGDIYIGPEAVVALYNVTVKGDIYVLGGLEISGVSARSLYACYMTFSYITTYRHGEVCVSGSNSFYGEMSFESNYCPDIPVRVDEAYNIDGKLYMTGAVADIADMYISDVKIDTGNSGKFIVEDIEIGNADSITIKWIMYDGSIKEKEVSLNEVAYAEIKESQTVADVKNTFHDANTDIAVTDAYGKKLQDTELVGTGCVIQFIKDNDIVDRKIVAISGDVDGDGTISVLDMEAVQKDILGIRKLEGVYKKCALLTEKKETISVLDMEAIQKKILGII